MTKARMLKAVVVVALLCSACTALAAPATTQAAGGTVLQVLRDCEADAIGGKRPAIVMWNWTPEQKASALAFSSVEIVGGSPFGQKCLKLVVSADLPKRPGGGYRMIPLGVDYLPPEADAVRLRVKVLKGRLTITAGGPTVYFGHSDVVSRVIPLDAATHGEWSAVELNLNHGLTRNYRRSQWAHHSPVIYYTRWIQEPLAIEVATDSEGEMLVDQIELIAHGEGRPYPTFEPAQIKTFAPGLDFEDPVSMEKAFTIMTNTTEQPDFGREPHLVRKAWPPPRLARVAEGQAGRHSLEMVMTGAEEACFAGVRLTGVADANAIALTLKAGHPGPGKPGIVLDFLAYAAPAEQRGTFPWDDLRPPPSWRNNSGIAFTHYLSPKNPAVERASFSFYHTRRMVPKDQWVTLVLPLADFICSYGQGDMKRAFQEQTPLTGDGVFALTFLSYYGQRSGPTRLLIDDVRFVRVPGTAEELRSFHQEQLRVGPER